MLDIKNLLQRKTVRNFLPKKIKPEILKAAIKAAYRAPTSCNSKAIVLIDISNRTKAKWLTQQKAPQTAPHLFLFAASEKIGEKNARNFLFKNFKNTEADSAMQHFLKIKKELIRRQAYLVAGYFGATLEAAGINGCWIEGFNKRIAKDKLRLKGDYYPELIFACGYVDKKNPGLHKTKLASDFRKFYLPKN